jgi:hypothetical protein
MHFPFRYFASGVISYIWCFFGCDLMQLTSRNQKNQKKKKLKVKEPKPASQSTNQEVEFLIGWNDVVLYKINPPMTHLLT